MADEIRLNRLRQTGDSVGNTMGSLGQTANSNDNTKSYADKVDLNDLDWEDRERVLRLLFSKINAGVHPSNHWKGIEDEGEDGEMTENME
jgi:hypothetical protein